jgi:succinoglycan biosynthesis protein ExoA
VPVSDPVDCSILVPVYNEERYIDQSVAAMRAQQFDGNLEFLLVDGGSDDDTARILSHLAVADPRVRVLQNPRRTVSSGLNVGLASALGTWVARMDAHAVYPPDYVARGIRRLQRGDSRWISGPQLPRGSGTISRAVELAVGGSLGRGTSRKWSSATSEDAPEFELDTGVFGGVWERRTLLEYGGWDERWDKNEDAEMAARFLERGERLICLPQMVAEYAPRDSLAGVWNQYRGYGRFRVRTARHHPSSMRRSQLLPVTVLGAMTAALVGPRRSRRLGRGACALYGAALLSAGVRSLDAAGRPTDAALVPLVLAAMHLGYGSGSIEGVVRYGPPLAAIASAVGLERAAGIAALPVEAVYAPSLT